MNANGRLGKVRRPPRRSFGVENQNSGHARYAGSLNGDRPTGPHTEIPSLGLPFLRPPSSTSCYSRKRRLLPAPRSLPLTDERGFLKPTAICYSGGLLLNIAYPENSYI